MAVKDTKTGIPLVDEALKALRDKPEPKTGLVLAFGATDLDTGTAVRYLWPWSGGSAGDGATVRRMPLTRDGTLCQLKVSVVTAGTGASDITMVVQVNGRDTELQVTFPNTTAGVFSSKSNVQVPAKENDKLSLAVHKTAVLTTSPAHIVAVFELV